MSDYETLQRDAMLAHQVKGQRVAGVTEGTGS